MKKEKPTEKKINSKDKSCCDDPSCDCNKKEKETKCCCGGCC